ncbi:MAG: NAD(P)/FAD-dependent oxidoreductase [Saccharofermentanales bacterium]
MKNDEIFLESADVPGESGVSPKQVCVIGAGLTGLTVAYRLSKQGFKVTVLESTMEAGGMVSSFSIGREKIEHIYHHIFTSDSYVMDLAEELGIAGSIRWHEPHDALYMDKKLYPFSSPVDLVKFKPIPFLERIRTGLAVLKAKKVHDIGELEKMTANEWLIRNSGQKAYNSLWKPLLRSKFDNDASRVSAVWIWNKFKLRGNSRGRSATKEMLGYMEGSFRLLIEALVKAITANGGSIRFGYTVFGITKSRTIDGTSFRLTCMLEDCSSVEIHADSIAATVSASRFAAMTGELGLPEDYRRKATGVKYKGDLCMILRLRKGLSPYYWTTVCDTLPFVVVVEHTNLTSLRKYGGHIVYLSRYLDITEPLWIQSDSEIYKLFCKGLADMYPDFRVSDVKDWRLTRTRYAQPVIGKNYSEEMPAAATPQKGVFLAGMAQIYPEDRGMNYAIRLGNQTADGIREYLGSDV